MITALDQPADRAVGLAAGADDFFVKPVEDEVLFARMDALAKRPAVRAATG
jgi:two-component system cell cycle response regulator